MSHIKTRPACIPQVAGLMLAVCCALASAQEPEAVASTGSARKVNVNEYIVRGNSVLDARAIERAVTPYLGPDRSMADIEAARAALQEVYQSAGYQSVYVDLPEQQVSGGIVFLQVNETRLGKVTVDGAHYNDAEALRARVPALQEGEVPDFGRAQAQLTELSRGAKRQVIPLVQQGETPGTMDVQLKVKDESPWRFGASVNNDHSADTSALRAVLSVGNDNLWQKEHTASLTWFVAPEDLGEANVWSASYAMPLGSPDWMLEFSGNTSDSDVLTQGNTNVTGKGHSLGAKLSRTLPMSGAWWHQLSLGVTFNDREERIGMLGQDVQYVPLKYAPITVAYSGFRQGGKHQLATGMQLVFGTRSMLGYGSNAAEFDWARFRADPSFVLVKADVSDTYSFEGGEQLFGRLSVQGTDRPLVSSEQMAAGGMYTVRGYRSAEAIGDYGAVASLEWRTRPLGIWGLQDWRFYTYLDGAWLRLRNPLPEQEDAFTLGAIGLGSSFRLFERVNVRLDYGYPLTDGPTTTQGAHRLHVSVGTSF